MAEFVIQVRVSAASPKEAVELIGSAMYDADLKRDWSILGGDRVERADLFSAYVDHMERKRRG